MFLEHLRQIITGYRQKIFIFIYSIKKKYKISLIISILGFLIYFITINKNKTFSRPIKIF